ncbi:MAG: YfaP family protein, partial [Planctomycetota bacterium]
DDEDLARFVKADLVVLLDWDTDGTDVDLWLTKLGATGARCWYKQPSVTWGAQLHEDQQDGYGPECISLPHAGPGQYRITVKYYSSDGHDIRSFAHVRTIIRVGTDRQVVHEDHIRLGSDGARFSPRIVTFPAGD